MQLERLPLGILSHLKVLSCFIVVQLRKGILCSLIKNIANDAAVIDLVLVQRGYCVVRYQGGAFRLALRFIVLVQW